MADGAQFSSIVTATSTGLAVSYGIKAHIIQIINDTSSQSVSVDLTGGGSVIATTSMSFQMKPLQSVGPLFDTYHRTFWTGYSAKTSDGSATIRVLALA